MTRPKTCSAAPPPEDLLRPAGPHLDAIGMSINMSALALFAAVAPRGTQLVSSDRRGRGYRMTQRIVDSKRCWIGTVMHNGPGQLGGHIEITGPNASDWFNAMKFLEPECRVTRRDEAWDFIDPGAYDRILSIMKRVKSKHKVKGQPFGDEDFADDGRTYYLGWKSPVEAKLYERGLHPDHRHQVRKPNLVRLELMVKPQGAAAQRGARDWAMGDIWGAREWSRELADLVLGISATPVCIQPGGRATDDDRMLWNLVARSGKRLSRLAHDLGGWAALGTALGELVEEHRRHRQA